MSEKQQKRSALFYWRAGNKIVIIEGSARHIGEVFDVQIERSSGFSLYGDPAVL